MKKSLWQVIQELAPNSPTGLASAWSADSTIIAERLAEAGHTIEKQHLPIVLQYAQSLAPEFPWFVSEGTQGGWHFSLK